MRKYICIIVLALIVTIGCATTAVEKTQEAYLDRGNSYYRSGEYQRAIKAYNQAIRLDPKFAMAYNNRGLAYGHKGQHDKAIADYNKAIEITPRDAEAYYNRGVACYYKREYDKTWKDVHMAQSLGYQVHPGFLKALREASGRQR